MDSRSRLGLRPDPTRPDPTRPGRDGVPTYERARGLQPNASNTPPLLHGMFPAFQTRSLVDLQGESWIIPTTVTAARLPARDAQPCPADA
jgi:hypothetical protein